MNGSTRTALLLAVSVFAGATVWAATLGQEGAPVTHPPTSVQHPVGTKSQNLKVLPKDLSEEDVYKLMLAYQQYLGVPCGYCHEENPDTKQIDYASDENPLKERARFMIGMTSDINNKYLAQLGDRRYADPITCGNCHRGQVMPPNFDLK